MSCDDPDCKNCFPSLEDCIDSAKYFFSNGNYRCTYYHFERAVELYDDRDAHIYVGIMYERGWYLEKDYTKAVQHYRSAAAKGAQDAQYRLGIFYINGRPGITKNHREALYWFQKAAEITSFVAKLNWLNAIPQADMFRRDKAQYFLGRMYYYGEGTSADISLAIQWYIKSANQDNNLAQSVLNGLFTGSLDKLKSIENKTLLLEYLRKSARNNRNAQSALEYLTEDDDDSDDAFLRRIQTTDKPISNKEWERYKRIKENNEQPQKRRNQNLTFRSGTEKFLYVGDLEDALPDDNSRGYSSTDSSISETSDEPEKYFYVNNTRNSATGARKQPPVFFNVDDTRSDYNRRNEQLAKFFHV